MKATPHGDHTHPQTTGRCDRGVAAGRQCKLKSVVWQGYLAGRKMVWSERCKRHQLPMESYVTTIELDECGRIATSEFMAALESSEATQRAERARAAAAGIKADVATWREACQTDDGIAAFLDSRTGLNGGQVLEGACEHCGESITLAHTGRPRRFCGTRCRVAAHRAQARA